MMIHMLSFVATPTTNLVCTVISKYTILWDKAKVRLQIICRSVWVLWYVHQLHL